jgi:uncharacterized protein (DUF433 family)
MSDETLHALLRNLAERIEFLEAKFDHPALVELMTPRVVDAIPGRWQDCLTFDRDVSEDSPVVKGTLVTVKHVVSLIVDGWTYNDVIRAHPELTVDDIRTCLAFDITKDAG